MIGIWTNTAYNHMIEILEFEIGNILIISYFDRSRALSMRTDFYIDKGTLIFGNIGIEINDDKRLRWAWFVNIGSPIISFLSGLTFVFHFYKTRLDIQVYLGIALIAISVYSLIFKRRTNFDRYIGYENIDKVIIYKGMQDMHATIFTKTRGNRQVILNFDRFSLSDFENSLTNKNILSEIC